MILDENVELTVSWNAPAAQPVKLLQRVREMISVKKAI